MDPEVATNGVSKDMDNVKLNGPANAGKKALQRKQSTPMMPPFLVSAPGKVIAFGEHAVVHGKVWAKSSFFPLNNQVLTWRDRQLLQRQSLYDPTSSLQRSPSPSAPFLYDFQT